MRNDAPFVTITLPFVTQSANKLIRTHWAKRRRIQHGYEIALIASGVRDEAFQAKKGEVRRIKFNVFRRSLLDRDNLIGGLKPLVDALRHVGVLSDDTEALLKWEDPEQIPVREKALEATVIYIWKETI